MSEDPNKGRVSGLPYAKNEPVSVKYLRGQRGYG